MDRNDLNEGLRYRVPACSICEEEGIVTVRLEMPGVPKDGVEVRIEGNELSVTGKRPDEAVSGSYLLRERRSEPYRKLFTIDDSFSREKVDASFANGILSLSLHVKEAAKPRHIEIA